MERLATPYHAATAHPDPTETGEVRAEEALRPRRGCPGIEHAINATDLADGRRRPDNLGLDGPNDERAPGGVLVDRTRIGAPSSDEHGEAEIERADREMNVMDSARGAFAEEPLFVFEQIRAFAISADVSRAKHHKNVARRLLTTIELAIVRTWYEAVGWMKVVQYHCGLRRP